METEHLVGMQSSDNHGILVSENDEERRGFSDRIKDFIQDIRKMIPADVTGVQFQSISHKRADIVVNVLIENPTPRPINITSAMCSIESGEREFYSGWMLYPVTISEDDSVIIKILVPLDYEKIERKYACIKPGSIIACNIKVELSLDISSEKITRALEKEFEVPMPYKPNFDIEKIDFVKFTFSEIRAILHLKLENHDEFDLGVNLLTCEIWLADVMIGTAVMKESSIVEKNGFIVIEIPIVFTPKDFGFALRYMIRGRSSMYSIGGSIMVDSPFGYMRLPINMKGCATSLKINEGLEFDRDETQITRFMQFALCMDKEMRMNRFFESITECAVALRSGCDHLEDAFKELCKHKAVEFLKTIGDFYVEEPNTLQDVDVEEPNRLADVDVLTKDEYDSNSSLSDDNDEQGQYFCWKKLKELVEEMYMRAKAERKDKIRYGCEEISLVQLNLLEHEYFGKQKSADQKSQFIQLDLAYDTGRLYRFYGERLYIGRVNNLKELYELIAHETLRWVEEDEAPLALGVLSIPNPLTRTCDIFEGHTLVFYGEEPELDFQSEDSREDALEVVDSQEPKRRKKSDLELYSSTEVRDIYTVRYFIPPGRGWDYIQPYISGVLIVPTDLVSIAFNEVNSMHYQFS